MALKRWLILGALLLGAATPATAQISTRGPSDAALLTEFGKLEASLGLPAGDLANATALYVIASYEAARDVTLDPSKYKPIIERFKAGYSNNPAFAKTSPAERRALYERLAIAGMRVAAARAELARHPNAEAANQLKATARENLAQLQLDADTMSLDTAAPAAKPAFEYLAAPGKGVSPSQIEAIAYTWEQRYTIGGMQMEEQTYLLLKGGRVRYGLPPVGPDQFDAAAEQRGKPGAWGTWKKQGNLYAFDAGHGFAIPHNEIVYAPGNPDETLDGTYKASSSYAIPGGAGSWSFRTLTLSRDHRFSRSHSGGVGGSSGFGDARIVAGTVYNDTGSVSSVSGANVGGGASRRSTSTAADREGTYRIRGYTLELHYDNGAVENRFFFTNAKRETIWFDGETMARQKR